MPRKSKPSERYNVPVGFVPTDEMEDILASHQGSYLEANAYSCTGEEVDSVEEAHTVVVRIYEGEEPALRDPDGWVAMRCR